MYVTSSMIEKGITPITIHPVLGVHISKPLVYRVCFFLDKGILYLLDYR